MSARTTLRVRRLVVPESVDAPDADLFRRVVDVRNAIMREVTGRDDHLVSAAEALPHYQSNPYETRHAWVLFDGDDLVGRMTLDLPSEEGSRVAYGTIGVLRPHWSRGIGTRAHDVLEDAVRADGRSVLQTWAEHAGPAEKQLEAPTGYGRIPLDHAARFLLRHGYALGQVERCSAFDLRTPADSLRTHYETAATAARGYRVVQWEIPTPPERRLGFAAVKERMSTDVPAADLEFDEQHWDQERVIAHDRRSIDAGVTVQVTAAEHIDTGRLCAFNELTIGGDPAGASHQEDTLVLREHRGNRLGMLVKSAGLLSWRERFPDSPRVITYNAEENRPMLDINEALGFVPLSYTGAWKKTL